MPGQRGVVITDRTVNFGDLYTLSQNAGGIEFSLVSQRVYGQLVKVLYSGDAWVSPVPFGARPIAHVHPNVIPGQEVPSLADINLLSDRYYEKLLANPNARPEPSRIVWGAGNTDNTIYYGGVGKEYTIIKTPKGNQIVYQ